MAFPPPGHDRPAVRIRDVSPRLVFQAQAGTTGLKIELIERLIAAGVRAIEASSFVHPKLVPGLADAEQVFAQVKRREGVSLECCVGNLTGLKRAIDARADAAWFLLSADEEFSRDNIGRGIEDSLLELARMREFSEGSGTRLGTYVIAVFGGMTGLARGPEEFAPVANRLIDLGVQDWILADSFGYAAPPQVREMVEFARTLTETSRLRVQIHDSRGMGLANIAELVKLGIQNIDTSLAGSGGHPAMPRANLGGVCTEDAVQMLDLMGVDTGVDLAALIDTANWLDQALGGRGKGFTRHIGKVPAGDHEMRISTDVNTFNWTTRPPVRKDSKK
jgi:hydroxymethylglutaryl-CoA lyase